MKNKKLFSIIYISFLIICLIALITFSILGNKTRIGYLGEFKFDETHINKTLELNGFDIEETKKLFTIDNILNNDALTNYIFTNEAITNYSYGFRIKYYSKVFRNSDIYGVYIDTNKIINDNNFIKSIKLDGNGSPYGNLVSAKIIDFEKIDNVSYRLRLKLNFVVFIIFIFMFFSIFIIPFSNKKINFLYDKNYKQNVFANVLKYLFFIFYIVFIIIGIYHHEPWRDEGQAWLIARDLSLLDILFQTGIEGHPFLFFFIIKPFTALPFYPTLHIINALFMIIAVYFIIFKSKKYNLLLLFFIIFNYIVMYEYPIVARNYGLSFMLFVLMIYFYENRYTKTTRYVLSIGLLLNTTVVGTSIGVIESFFFLYKIFSKNNNTFIKKKLKDIIILYLFLLAILFQILIMAYKRSNILSFIKNEQFFYLLSLLIVLFAAAVFVIFVYLKINNKFTLPKLTQNKEFILKLILLLVFIISVNAFYRLSDRHLFIFILYAIYILDSFFIKKPDLFKLSLDITFILLIIYLYGFNINTYINDIKYDFSFSKKAVKYIKENKYDDTNKYIIIINGSHFLSASISPYFKEKIIYDSGLDKFITFTDWVDKKRNNKYSNTNFITNIYNKTIISLDKEDNGLKYIKLTNFEGISEYITFYMVTNK